MKYTEKEIMNLTYKVMQFGNVDCGMIMFYLTCAPLTLCIADGNGKLMVRDKGINYTPFEELDETLQTSIYKEVINL